ncbi:MAG TPA: hypothetical protein VN874_01645 [Myxococcales bacterium]|nr:hypothetical protein [Myxococcales bacterium]
MGAEVERARRDCVRSGEPGHAEAAQRLHHAIAAAWPPAFFDQLQRCKHHDQESLDDMLDFVEACPRFFRTGYFLGMALRWLPRPPRSPTQTERMRAIVLAAVEGRPRLPFRRIPSLARAVDSKGMRAKLRLLVEDPDPSVRKRAMTVLDGLSGPRWDPGRAREQREEQRIRSMVVTAQKRKSAALVRRVLAIDPRPLTTRGRKYLAVVFEFTMNWGLIPDEELLAIAQRLEGPEMAPIWGYALARSDAPGDRARWILARLRAP